MATAKETRLKAQIHEFINSSEQLYNAWFTGVDLPTACDNVIKAVQVIKTIAQQGETHEQNNSETNTN